jgi:hypothetical protein
VWCGYCMWLRFLPEFGRKIFFYDGIGEHVLRVELTTW